MRITLESDYALRILTAMAGYEGITDASKIAEDTSVTPRFALKILHKLVQGGLVSSYKGAKGGYTIKVPAEKITLKQVIELIDGPICIARCVEGECSLNNDKTACVYHHIFDTVSFDLAKKLDAITISDVINKTYKLN